MPRVRTPFDHEQAANAPSADSPANSLEGWRPARLAPLGRRDWQSWLAGPMPMTGKPDPARDGLAGLFGAAPDRGPANGVRPLSPRIETDRLILRVIELDDFAEYADMLADQDTFRFSERGAMKGDEAWTRLLRQVGHWALMGWGLFAVEEKASGRLVGEVGLGDFRRDLGAPFQGVPEAGWTIAPEKRGLGYATEAMNAALAWIEERLGAERTVCLIHVDNEASLRVADKLGYRQFGAHTYRGYDALMFERCRDA